MPRQRSICITQEVKCHCSISPHDDYTLTGKSLRVVLGEDTNLDELAHKIRHHTSLMIKELTIESQYTTYRGETEPQWQSSPESSRSLFEALGELPMLKKIHLQGLGKCSEAFPLELLTYLLINPMRSMYLTDIKLDQCKVVYRSQEETDQTEDSIRFVRSLQQLFKLRSFEWSEHEQPTKLECNNSSCCNLHVIQTVLSLPRLQDLRIEASLWHCHQFAALSTEIVDSVALERFLRSSHCRSLTLNNIPLGSSSLAALTLALESFSCSLKSLTLDLCHSKADDVKNFFVALKSNQCVTQLGLWVPHNETSWKEQQCFPTLAYAMTHNKHISSLQLMHHSFSKLSSKPSRHPRVQFPEDDAFLFAHLLQSNQTLTALSLYGYNDQNNHGPRGLLAPAIDFYTQMNQNGDSVDLLPRMTSFSMTTWMRLLSVRSNKPSNEEHDTMQNLEAVHFWLRRSPTILSSSSSSYIEC